METGANKKQSIITSGLVVVVVICMKRKLIVCLATCLILCIPLSYATSESWSYRIDGVSASAMTQDGKNILVGSSFGFYYLFNEFGEVIRQENLNGEITSVDINDENVILGTKSTASATFIFSLSGRKILHFTSDPVLSVAISENSSYAISGAEKYIYRFPSLKGGKVLNVDTPVNYVSISANGKKAAAATAEAIYVFNNDTDQYLVHPIPSTTSMQFLGESLIVGTEKGLLYLITETSGFGVVIGTGGKLIGDLRGAIVSIEVGTDVFIAGTSNGNVHLFNKGGTEIRNFSIDRKMVDCDMSSDGKFIAAASPQNLYMLDENGKILWQKDVSGIKSAEMSSDGKNIVVVADNTFLFFSNWQYIFKGDSYYPYSSRQEYSFEDFRSIWIYPVSVVGEIYTEEPYIKIGVGDVNGDGENEIVASSGRNLIILNSEKKVLWKKSYTRDVIGVTLMDLNNDTVPEVVYTLRDGRYNLFILDAKKDEIIEFDFMDYFYPSIVGDKEKEVSMIPIVSYDIDDDSKTEILAVVNAGYSLKPRGIFAFEYPSKNVEWFYETGPLVTFEAFCDIDQDGKPEIILGSRSPCNGNKVGQQDDCHVYLTVLNCSGREIWGKEISEGFKVLRVGVGDVNDDGDMEIVGTVSSAGNTYGRLFVMDSNGEMLYDHELKYSLWLGGIADFNNDRFLEIVTTDSEGFVNIYNFNLEPIKTYKIGGYLESDVEGINDIDGDGDNEIILKVWDKSAIILNSDLEEEWNEEFDYLPSILVTNISGCGNDLLILAESLQLFSFEKEGEYLCAKFISPPTETPEPTSPPPTETPELSPERLSAILLLSVVAAIITIVWFAIYLSEKIGKRLRKTKSENGEAILDTGEGSDVDKEKENSSPEDVAREDIEVILNLSKKSVEKINSNLKGEYKEYHLSDAEKDVFLKEIRKIDKIALRAWDQNGYDTFQIAIKRMLWILTEIRNWPIIEEIRKRVEEIGWTVVKDARATNIVLDSIRDIFPDISENERGYPLKELLRDYRDFSVYVAQEGLIISSNRSLVNYYQIGKEVLKRKNDNLAKSLFEDFYKVFSKADHDSFPDKGRVFLNIAAIGTESAKSGFQDATRIFLAIMSDKFFWPFLSSFRTLDIIEEEAKKRQWEEIINLCQEIRGMWTL